MERPLLSFCVVHYLLYFGLGLTPSLCFPQISLELHLQRLLSSVPTPTSLPISTPALLWMECHAPQMLLKEYQHDCFLISKLYLLRMAFTAKHSLFCSVKDTHVLRMLNNLMNVFTSVLLQ